MPKNQPREVNLEDYVLKPNANLSQLAKDVRAGLEKILPGVAIEEYLEMGTSEGLARTDFMHINYHDLLGNMQAMRQNRSKYAPANTVLTFEARGGELCVEFFLNDSAIKGYELSTEQKNVLYKTLKPYIIKKPKEVQNA